MKTFLQRLGKRVLIRLAGVAIAAVCLAGYFIYQRFNGGVKPTIVLNDNELTTDMTVQSIVNNDLQVRESPTADTEINIGLLGIPANTYIYDRYYIFAKNDSGEWEYTNLCFSVYNDSPNASNLACSKVYLYQYDATGSSNCEVTINGINFSGLNPTEAVEAFKKSGLKFKSSDCKEFLNGSANTLYGKPTDYKYSLTQDADTDSITTVKIEKHLNKE